MTHPHSLEALLCIDYTISAVYAIAYGAVSFPYLS